MHEQHMAKLAAASEMVDCRRSIIDKTKNEIQMLEKNLANKKELLELLESEPKIQRVLDLMMGSRY